MADPSPVTRQDLLTAMLAGAPAVERVRTVRVEMAPGLPAGRHRHPCPVVGLVLEGTIRFQIAGEAETILHPGDAFFEPADVEVAHFDNASAGEPAAFLACYLLSPGEDRLIEMLD